MRLSQYGQTLVFLIWAKLVEVVSLFLSITPSLYGAHYFFLVETILVLNFYGLHALFYLHSIEKASLNEEKFEGDIVPGSG
jgi:hypothetical protein